MNRKEARIEALDLISVLIEENLGLVLDPYSNRKTESETVRVKAEMLWIVEAIKEAVRENSSILDIPF